VDEFDPLGSNFKDVQTTVDPRSSTQSDPASGRLSRSGLLNVKTEGTKIIDHIANGENLNINLYHSKFRVDAVAKTVAIIPVAPTTPNSMPVRRSADGKTVTLYLHGVFEEYPQLRPSGTREVLITLHSSGKAAIINLAGGGLSVQTTPRSSSSESGSEQEQK
jgi:hypothetical protein